MQGENIPLARGTGVTLFRGIGTGVALFLDKIEAGGEIFFVASETGVALFLVGISTTGLVSLPALVGVDSILEGVVFECKVGVVLRARLDFVRGAGIGVNCLPGGRTIGSFSKQYLSQ